MARKLKTYITNLGFFELALAAPSMKAALEAWGMGHNAFHQGFARETHDARIVAATMAMPGVVLKRPVGTKGAFTQKGTLPKDWSLAPPDAGPSRPVTKAKKPPRSAKTGPAKTVPAKTRPAKTNKPHQGDKAERAAIISFEKEKARRQQAREKVQAREEAREERIRAKLERDTAKAEAALARAEERHAGAMAAIERERDKLDRRAALENERWDAERETLKDDLQRAKND